MKYIWKNINNMNLSSELKSFFFLLTTTLLFSISGLAAWYLLHFFMLNKISWALCFTGYPGFFIGFIGGIIYLCRCNT